MNGVKIKRCPICGRFPKIRTKNLRDTRVWCHPLFHPLHHEVRVWTLWESEAIVKWNEDVDRIAEAIKVVNEKVEESHEHQKESMAIQDFGLWVDLNQERC